MGILFPVAPLHGAQYTPPGIPVTWQYDSGRNAWRVLRGGTPWTDITGKPSTFPPSDHEHDIADVTGLQTILDVKQDITARGLPDGYAPLDSTGKVPENMIPFGALSWANIEDKPSEFPPSAHSHPVAEISDSSSIGQQLVRAPTPQDARGVIGAIGADENARVQIRKAGINIGMRRAINLIEGLNITMAVTDDSASEEVDVTINAAGGAAGAARYFVTEVKPVAPLANDIWFDAATGLIYTYYNDGTTLQWIESIPFLANQPAAFAKIVFPVAPTDGQIFEPISGARWKWSAVRGVWFASTSVSDAYTKVESDAKFVDLAGDVMTGVLTLSGPPTANLHATTKLYTDTADNALATAKVAKAGDTMTGHLVLPTGPGATNAVRKDYVDAADATLTAGLAAKVDKAGDTMTGLLTLSGAPTVDLHAATKKYADDGDAALNTAKVAKAGDTMTGALTINMASPSLILNKATGANINSILGTRESANRWAMQLGGAASETGGDAGSPFILYKYNDAGAAAAAITISRVDGLLTLAGDPTAALHAATKQYVDNKAKITSQVFTTASGTWLRPAGCIAIKVRMIGAGGGGAGSGTGAGNGSAAGNSTFSTFTANGGGGATGASGAFGGLPLSGAPVIRGGQGGNGSGLSTGSRGGQGGGTPFGSGGVGGAPGAGAGLGATPNTGAGGGGGGVNSTPNGGGGGGGGGYLETIINSPAASYAYAVGAFGAGGSAGTGGAAGGNGGSGLIIVEEFY